MTDKTSVQPLKLSTSFEEGRDLEPMEAWPAEMMIRPITTHRQITWYAGPMLTAMIYEADDGILQFTDIPYDQQVRILAGTAILTSADGERHSYEVGDSFVVPKGWSGSWELRDGCREAIIFETASLRRTMQQMSD